MMDIDRAFLLVREELHRAQENYPTFYSGHEGYAIIREEVDELWDEIKSGQGYDHRAVSEAVQSAAMCIRYLVDLCTEEGAAAHERKVLGVGEFATRPRSSIGGYSG